MHIAYNGLKYLRGDWGGGTDGTCSEFLMMPLFIVAISGASNALALPEAEATHDLTEEK